MSSTPRTYTVLGMTCERCKLAVIVEVAELSGVEAVDVDLDSGRLTVVGDANTADVAAAVREAGYEVSA
jgi:copper chaperone